MKRAGIYLTDQMIRDEINKQTALILRMPLKYVGTDPLTSAIMSIVLQSIRPPDRYLSLDQFSAEIIVPSIRLVLGRA